MEARLSLELGSTVVLPAAVRHQTELATNLAALKAVGVEPDLAALDAVSGPVTALRSALTDLGAALSSESADAEAEAKRSQDVLLPAMAAVRGAVDELEGVVADDLWPLPTYQEMLYIL